MPKTNKTVAAPSLVEEHKAASNTPSIELIDMKASSGERPAIASAMDQIAADFTKRAEAKVSCLASAVATLTEAKRLYDEAATLTNKAYTGDADKVAAVGAMTLYQGLTGKLFGPDEMNETLRQVFGAKPKADGTDGKTPAGEGESIRKRVVRAVQINEVRDTLEAPAKGFCADLEADTIAQMVAVLEAVEKGDRPLFTAYDDWQRIKTEAKPQIDPLFDPAKVKKMIDKLATPEAVDRIGDNALLLAVYGQFRALLNEIDAAITAHLNS